MSLILGCPMQLRPKKVMYDPTSDRNKEKNVILIFFVTGELCRSIVTAAYQWFTRNHDWVILKPKVLNYIQIYVSDVSAILSWVFEPRQETFDFSVYTSPFVPSILHSEIDSHYSHPWSLFATTIPTQLWNKPPFRLVMASRGHHEWLNS